MVTPPVISSEGTEVGAVGDWVVGSGAEVSGAVAAGASAVASCVSIRSALVEHPADIHTAANTTANNNLFLIP